MFVNVNNNVKINARVHMEVVVIKDNGRALACWTDVPAKLAT